MRLDPEEMEDISYRSLDESVYKRNFLADVAFQEQKIHTFDRYVKSWKDTGKTTPVNAILPGEKWYVNNELLKDRSQGLTLSDGTSGAYDNLGNNMVRMFGELPYLKLLKALEKDEFHVYTEKPMKIKDRKKVY